MSIKSDALATRGLIALTTVFSLIIIFLLISLKSAPSVVSDVVISEGIQYIDLTAKGGYSPRELTAKANINTVLRVKTSGTFDCSSALVIPKLNYRNNLPPTGITEIKIPPQDQNTEMRGTCSMGMYKFNIKFI